jgi:AraC-like DNA-binding protein
MASWDPADSSLRPEWLFEVVNATQAHVYPPEFELLRRLLDAVPPESEIEHRITASIFARLQAISHRESRLAIEKAPTLEDNRRDTESQTVARSVAEAEKILRTECNAHWTVERIARRVGCNRTDLEAAFRRHGLRTLHGYLVLCRIERARQLLRNTAWRIEEIARGVGYRSKTSLHEQFRRETAMSPEDYRVRWRHTRPNRAVLALLDHLSS